MESGDPPHPNWKALATAQLKWKVFVQAKPETLKAPAERKNTLSNSISGDDAKKFYEDLLQKGAPGEESEEDDDSEEIEFVGTCNSKRKRSQSKQECPQIIHKAMKYAQDNDEGNLRKMLDGGLNVNTRDEYGWSLLMVAACGGAHSVVRTLLERKAKTSIRDSKGNTAIYLATIKGHHNIVDMLIKCNKRKEEDTNVNTGAATSSSEKIEEFHCDVCNITIRSSTRIQHETSIVHQFKLGSGNQKTIYGIPASNKGYQMLLNQGWDTEKGLGPDSTGAKYPVRTALKKDRKGIGANTETPMKVTHFGPGDTDAVKIASCSGVRIERQRTISKKERKRERLREKRREIDIRRALNEPDY